MSPPISRSICILPIRPAPLDKPPFPIHPCLPLEGPSLAQGTREPPDLRIRGIPQLYFFQKWVFGAAVFVEVGGEEVGYFFGEGGVRVEGVLMVIVVLGGEFRDREAEDPGELLVDEFGLGRVPKAAVAFLSPCDGLFHCDGSVHRGEGRWDDVLRDE